MHKKLSILLAILFLTAPVLTACDWLTRPEETTQQTEETPNTDIAPPESYVPPADSLPEYIMREYNTEPLYRMRRHLLKYLEKQGITDDSYEDLSFEEKNSVPEPLYYIQKYRIQKEDLKAYQQECMEAQEAYLGDTDIELLCHDSLDYIREYFTVDYIMYDKENEKMYKLDALNRSGTVEEIILAGWQSEQLNLFIDHCEELLSEDKAGFRAKVKPEEIEKARDRVTPEHLEIERKLLDYPFPEAFLQKVEEIGISSSVAPDPDKSQYFDPEMKKLSRKERNRLPWLCHYIRFMEIPKEALLEYHRKRREENDRDALTDEMVEILYCGDDQRIFETFVSPFALQHDGSAYTPWHLIRMTDQEIIDLKIPKQKLLDYLQDETILYAHELYDDVLLKNLTERVIAINMP